MKPVRPIPWLVVASALGLALGAACDKKTGPSNDPNDPANVGLGLPETHSSGERIRMAQPCKLDETVREPAGDSPEFVVRELLRAARSEVDDDASFQSFYKQFPPEKREEEVKQLYWSKARKYVSKYLVEGEEDAVFVVCRREPQGDNRVKLFIKSFDMEKSNPPISLQKDDAGAWKVVFYTP